MIFESDFRPGPLLANRHLQTLLGPLTVSVRHHPERWQTVSLPDDDFLELAWFGGSSGPVLVIAHGLEGSYQSHYIQRVTARFLREGWRIAVVHFRSCGRELNRRMNTYHSGSSDEFGYALDFILNQVNSPVYGLGFSLGGNVLLKWLGEHRQQSMLKRAMAVSVPLKLDICASAISRGLSRIYQKHLIDLLKQKALKKSQLNLPGPKLAESLDFKAIKNFWQFDHQITAPLNGFTGVDDYYQRASSFNFLSEIKTDTLILQALDDPFMSPEIIPDPHHLGSGVKLELSRYGGHVGFLNHLNVYSRDCFLATRVYQFMTDT